MNFSAKYNDESQESLVLMSESGACWNCGGDTHWVDIDFGAFLCSEECLDNKCREYAEASR